MGSIRHPLHSLRRKVQPSIEQATVKSLKGCVSFIAHDLFRTVDTKQKRFPNDQKSGFLKSENNVTMNGIVESLIKE